jgi:hypothetical protein
MNQQNVLYWVFLDTDSGIPIINSTQGRHQHLFNPPAILIHCQSRIDYLVGACLLKSELFNILLEKLPVYKNTNINNCIVNDCKLESIPTAIHLRKNFVNHRPKIPIAGLVHIGQHPSLESAVSAVINAWLKKYTDPTSSCGLPISHRTQLAKTLKGRSRRSCARKRRSFCFAFSSVRTLPTTRTAPSSSLKSAH